MNKKIIIAIDGHSSCGKSTVARQVAHALQYNYVDSGSMYRAVTLFALRNKLIINGLVDSVRLVEMLPLISISFKYNPEEQKSDTYLNGENVEKEIRGLEVSNNVSQLPLLRKCGKLWLKFSRKWGEKKGLLWMGAILGQWFIRKQNLKYL